MILQVHGCHSSEGQNPEKLYKSWIPDNRYTISWMTHFLKNISLIILALYITSAQASGGTVLHQSSNEFGSMWVYEKGEMLCISFKPPDNPVAQSCMLEEKPKITLFFYPQVMTSGAVFLNNNPHPQKILMLGLGGASIAKALNNLLPNADFDIVEINSEILPIAKKYFAFTPPPATKIHIEDGVEFVKNAPKSTYDIIIMDAFTEDYIPPKMLTKEFISDLKRILKEDGAVSVNTFVNSPVNDQEIELIKETFGSVFAMSHDGNRVIFAKKKDFPDINEIENRAVFWRFRLSTVGIDQMKIIELFKGMKKL